jgi:hypothetical protein
MHHRTSQSSQDIDSHQLKLVNNHHPSLWASCKRRRAFVRQQLPKTSSIQYRSFLVVRNGPGGFEPTTSAAQQLSKAALSIPSI